MIDNGKITLKTRASGLLLHPTSLPGPYGNGDLGPAAYGFADFLASAGQRWWQMLPVGPTGSTNSPYQSYSTYAGNPLLISLEKLAEQGLLTPEQLQGGPPVGQRAADFAGAAEFRKLRLRYAFNSFERRRRSQEYERFVQFCDDNGRWLTDYALFCMLKLTLGNTSWVDWPAAVRDRDPGALQEALQQHGREAHYYQFQQYQFARQWRELKQYCAGKGIGLLGDIPIFVAHDSADVWTHPELFFLDKHGQPTVVAGVPPDYFSETGQRWGNPLYKWKEHKRQGYAWWIERLRMMFRRFDAVRIDHFIGFHNYWEIPASEATAVNGRWVPGPGADFFTRVLQALGPVEIVAEDLGTMTDDVKALRDRFQFPGMRVLQFSFGPDPGAEENRPHHYPPGCIVYTGTHDNDTSAGWLKAGGPKASARDRAEREIALAYINSDGKEFHWDLIRMALMSNGNTAVIPVQDLLGLGSEARMNLPGRTDGEWGWRLHPGQLNDAIAARLAKLSKTYSRPPLAAAPAATKEIQA